MCLLKSSFDVSFRLNAILNVIIIPLITEQTYPGISGEIPYISVTLLSTNPVVFHVWFKIY